MFSLTSVFPVVAGGTRSEVLGERGGIVASPAGTSGGSRTALCLRPNMPNLLNEVDPPPVLPGSRGPILGTPCDTTATLNSTRSRSIRLPYLMPSADLLPEAKWRSDYGFLAVCWSDRWSAWSASNPVSGTSPRPVFRHWWWCHRALAWRDSNGPVAGVCYRMVPASSSSSDSISGQFTRMSVPSGYLSSSATLISSVRPSSMSGSRPGLASGFKASSVTCR